MVYGYCRISTPQQNIERQERNIRNEYSKAMLYKETYTGTTEDRPEFKKLLKRCVAGDTIVFDSVSRMSRNADEGCSLYEQLFDSEVELIFLKEPHINTATYKQALSNSVTLTGTNVDFILEGINRYLMALAKEQIRIAFEQAEKEVVDLHQRTKEGMETARLHGKQIGQRPGAKLNVKKSRKAKDTILRHSKNFGGSLTDAELISLTGLSRNTYYKYKRELKSD